MTGRQKLGYSLGDIRPVTMFNIHCLEAWSLMEEHI